ncbi:MAG TPA: SRPBCC domain-containing protein [Methylomirabilota bacterium]|nr:SRPBCC domain-containing protein [Methylomirabilota bacterium]
MRQGVWLVAEEGLGLDTPQRVETQHDATFRTRRAVPYAPRQVFEAFARPELLARWWGPNGFTNTFEVFEFRPGGRWTYVMHGPNGANFQNESVFLEVKAPSTLVIHHVSKPRYVLTVTLSAYEEGTAIAWAQEFEDSAVAARIRHIVEPANEQNLDRLQAVLTVGA